MRLRNRSVYQVTAAVAFILTLPQMYRCTTWCSDGWCYLDVQPSPEGDDYVALAKWAESSSIVLNRTTTT